MANSYMVNYPPQQPSNGNGNGNGNSYNTPSNPYGNIDGYGVIRAPGMQPMPNNNYIPQPQVQMQNNGIYGRFISKAEEITPEEIPMNGNISIFPMVDGSCIFTKKWTNGIINTGLYVPYVPQQEQLQQQQVTEAEIGQMDIVLQQLNEIKKMIAKNNQYKKSYNKNKNQGQKQTGVNEK